MPEIPLSSRPWNLHGQHDGLQTQGQLGAVPFPRGSLGVRSGDSSQKAMPGTFISALTA